MQQWSSYYRALASGVFCFTSLLFHQWSFPCEPIQAYVLLWYQNLLCLLISSWEHFSYLGAKGLQSTCSTFPQHPRVKGFTPPRNLPVTWKHIQDIAQTSGYTEVIIQPSESQAQACLALTLLPFPNRCCYCECCTSSLLLTHHLHQLLLSRRLINDRSLPKRAVSSTALGFEVVRFTSPCCFCIRSVPAVSQTSCFGPFIPLSLPLLCLGKSPSNKQDVNSTFVMLDESSVSSRSASQPQRQSARTTASCGRVPGTPWWLRCLLGNELV